MEPPTTASTIYTRPVPVAASETLKAIAAASGYPTAQWVLPHIP